MVGLTRANDLLLTSRVFTSDEAVDLGLVNAVFDAEQLLPEVYDYVRNMLATVSPDSLRQTRWQVYRDLHRDAAASVVDSEALINDMMKAPDYTEGVNAFLNRRLPVWGKD